MRLSRVGDPLLKDYGGELRIPRYGSPTSAAIVSGPQRVETVLGRSGSVVVVGSVKAWRKIDRTGAVRATCAASVQANPRTHPRPEVSARSCSMQDAVCPRCPLLG